VNNPTPGKHTAIVYVWGINDNRKVKVSVEDDGLGRRVPIGKVQIPFGSPMPEEGDLIEISYEYFDREHHLHNPAYLGPFQSRTQADQLSTLKLKL
jgi:hypothetical protein